MTTLQIHESAGAVDFGNSSMELHNELSIYTCLLVLAELNSEGILTDSKLHAVFNSPASNGGSSTAVLHQAIRGAISSLLSDPVNASEVVRVLKRIGKSCHTDSLVEAVSGTEPQSGDNDMRPQGAHLVEGMCQLLKSFTALCYSCAQSAATDNESAGKVKEVAREFLEALMPNARAYHMEQLEHLHSVKDILNYFIEAGFCSHLDCKFLLQIIELDLDEELGQMSNEFQKKHASFFKRTTLADLRDTISDNTDLQPTMSVGTPYIVLRLSGSWPALRIHSATTTLSVLLPWVETLQLEAVVGSDDNVAIVYCGVEQAFVSLVRDLQQPSVTDALKELDIVAEVRMAPQAVSVKHGSNSDESEMELNQDEEKVRTVMAELSTIYVSKSQQTDEEGENQQQPFWRLDSLEKHMMVKLEDLSQSLMSAQKTNDEFAKLENQIKSLTTEIYKNREKHLSALKAKQAEVEEREVDIANLKSQLVDLKKVLDTTKSNHQYALRMKDESFTQHEEMREEYAKQLASKQEQIELLQKQREVEGANLKSQLDDLKQVLDTTKRDHQYALMRKDESFAQLSGGLFKINGQFEEMREEYAKQLASKQEQIELLQKQLEEKKTQYVPQPKAPEAAAQSDTVTTLSSEGSFVASEQESYDTVHMDADIGPPHRHNTMHEFVVPGLKKK